MGHDVINAEFKKFVDETKCCDDRGHAAGHVGFRRAKSK
jgi:hypothetical protein